MEEFNGLHRNSTRGKTPANMWQNARNILTNKRKGSVTQEEGFDYLYDIPGKVIGKIETNEHIVYFSIDGELSKIGYKGRDGVYIPVLSTTLLGFNIRCAIEGIYFYNYKGDLIIMFCDGVLDYSNTPKLINLFNLGIELDVNYDLVNPDDILSLYLFPPLLQGTIDISYIDNSTLDIDIVYITYAYVLDDGISTSPFYVIQDIAYPTYGFEEEKRRAVQINFSDLDPKYNKIVIGLVVNNGEALLGYQSNPISYIGTEVQTIINSLTNYSSIAVDNLIVPSIVYSRIETMTKQYNKVAIGKLATEDSLDFQKYANLLEVESIFIDDIEVLDIGEEDQYFTHPTLCPDEVYSISIQPQLLNGVYLDSYHIPGRAAQGDETSTLTDADLTAMGLTDLIGTDTYKKFRIVNTGGFVIPAPYLGNAIANRRLTFGYWENQENYPNNDNYNSTVDYEGNPLGGSDLRGTPIRYHRLAGLDAITSKIPSLLGKTEKNKHNLTYDEDGFHGMLPKIGLRVLNFNTIIPLEIRNKLQGFRINIAKRSTGERLIEDISFIKQTERSLQEVDGGDQYMLSPSFGRPANEAYRTKVEQFGRSVIWSPTLGIYKPSITPQLIKANYGVDHTRGTIVGDSTLRYLFDPKDFYKINNLQKYAVIKQIEYLPANNTTADTLFMEEKIIIHTKNSLQSAGNYPDIGENRWNPLLISDYDNGASTATTVIDKFNPADREYDTITIGNSAPTNDIPYLITVCATLINLPKNVYSGFNTTEFICLGRLDIDNTTRILQTNGDIFTNNKISYPAGQVAGTSIKGAIIYRQLDLIGLLGIPNNSDIYIKDGRTLRVYELDDEESESSLVNTFQFVPTIFNKESYRSLNDKISALSFDINTPFVNYFPYRIALSLSIANENLQTNNVRTFLANSYYEMPNDKGDIVALRGSNKSLYIQQRYTLHIANIKDQLTTREGVTYLGESTLFDRIPNEIFDEQGGYIGCTSKFACIIIKEGYVTVDQVKGNIFIVGQGINEISKQDMSIWFENNWDIGNNYYYIDRNGQKQKVDNPYNSVGHLVGRDNKYNRLLFTKKIFTAILVPDDFYFDGEFYLSDINGDILYYIPSVFIREDSITLSYSLDDNKWICDHDYYPNVYITQNKDLFSINTLTNSKVYKHNSLTNKPGTYYSNITFSSYIDLIFNSRTDLVKLYQAVMWNTTTIKNINETLYRSTINAIMLYTDNQCSGILDLTNQEFNLYRDNEGIFNLNEFRDIVINNDGQIVRENGTINTSNLNITRSWFEKSNFISTFIIVRMIMTNTNTDNIYINNVNVKSRISQR